VPQNYFKVFVVYKNCLQSVLIRLVVDIFQNVTDFIKKSEYQPKRQVFDSTLEKRKCQCKLYDLQFCAIKPR
jgi:hypothetical protein